MCFLEDLIPWSAVTTLSILADYAVGTKCKLSIGEKTMPSTDLFMGYLTCTLIATVTCYYSESIYP